MGGIFNVLGFEKGLTIMIDVDVDVEASELVGDRDIHTYMPPHRSMASLAMWICGWMDGWMIDGMGV